MIRTSIAAAAALVCVAMLPPGIAHAANKPDLLTYIPADSPYVMAMTEPMPDALMDKVEPAMDEILKGYQTIVRQIVAEATGKMEAEEGGDEKAGAFRGVMDEVLNLMSMDGIRGAGIERDSGFAVYGNGLMPVVRLELSDEKLFNAAIARIEEKAGKSMSAASVDGNEYRFAEMEKIRLVLATLDRQAVITVVPTNYDESQIALALGIQKPRNSIAKAKTLRAIRKDYDFEKYFTGFFDTVRMVDTFISGPTGMDAQLFKALEFEVPELSAVCKKEFLDMARIAPRMIMGYTDVNADNYDASFVVELREDIANGLATLPAEVPGLGIDTGGLLSFGISMNPLKLREFYEARLDAMEADPYECEHFAELQAGVAKGREVLAQPIPPMVYGFRGIVANIADVQGLEKGANGMPESLDATLLFAMENAESLMMMATMMDPQIAALNLLPDGKPVKLDLPQISAFAEKAFAAMTENALSVSVGEKSEQNASSVLKAKSEKPAPFMSMSMDANRYYALIAESMDEPIPVEEGSKPIPPEIAKTIRELMVSIGSLYDRMAFDIGFTGRGIEMESRVTLAE